MSGPCSHKSQKLTYVINAVIGNLIFNDVRLRDEELARHSRADYWW